MTWLGRVLIRLHSGNFATEAYRLDGFWGLFSSEPKEIYIANKSQNRTSCIPEKNIGESI
jgi:hypothetical protein